MNLALQEEAFLSKKKVSVSECGLLPIRYMGVSFVLPTAVDWQRVMW